MAISTAALRQSAFVDPWGIVIPDGTIDSADRLTLLGWYGGFSAIAAPIGSGPDVRLYDSAGKRKYLPPITHVSYEVLEKGGFGKGSIESFIAWDGLVLVGNERVDVYYNGTLRYRGYVRIPERHIVGSGETASPTLGGLMDRIGKYQVRRRYAYGAPVDLSVLFADILDDEVTISSRLPTVVSDIQTVGVTISVFDAVGKTVRDAFDSICDIAPNLCIWGFDVDGTAPVPLDRAYIRPRPTATLYKPSIGKEIDSLTYSEDVTQVVNTLRPLHGGKVKYSNLAPNPSFENPQPNSELVGNLVTDYSFENGDPAWTVTGTIKTAPGDYPATGRTGAKWVECDQAGEKAEQIVTGIDYTKVYVASAWARRESPTTANTLTFEVEGLNAASSVVQTVTIANAQDPGAGGIYVRYYGDVDFTSNPTIVKARVRVKSLAGSASNDGIDFDDIALYIKNGVAQTAWTASAVGLAVVSDLDWAVKTTPATDRLPWHGGYCIKATPSGIVTSADYIQIYPITNSRVQLKPSTPYTILVYVRGEDAGGTNNIAISVGVVEYKSDGTVAQTSEGPIMAATAYDTWHRETAPFTTNINTAAAAPFVRVRANTIHYIDAVMLVERGTPDNVDSGVYWETDTFEWTVDVTSSQLISMSAAALASITNYGVQEGTPDNSSITDLPTAQIFASQYLNANAVPQLDNPLVLHEPTSLVNIDGLVKILNLPSAPDAAFPSRIETEFGQDGFITQTVLLSNARPELTDMLKFTAAQAVKDGQAVVV